METDDWQKFSEYSDKYYHDHNYQIYERLPANRPNLNLLWTKLKELLITTANKTVPCSYRSAEDRLLKPKVLITCYSALKKMNNILLKFRTKLISRALWPDDAEWSTLKNTIRLVIEEHQLDPLDLPVTITTDNVRPIKKLLLGTYKLIYHKARLERIRIEHSRIQSNIKLRCTNYDQDLTRMIDSILNRERRRIVLDRLLYKDPVQGHILITDADTIKKHAALHFQQYALPQSPPPPMNHRWTKQYAPKPNIKDEWYQSIMIALTREEWQATVQSLPNDKACGPSNLHNEFYKHADPKVADLTWHMTKMCFQLAYIPDE